MKTVYVDGQHGTTGLEIINRLEARNDVELIRIPHEKRRDASEREKLLNEADLVFLCLPDDAARDAVSLIKNPKTKIIDASTAHRIAEDWVYGLPEISGQRDKIFKSGRISNPGCYATGFILMLRPLIEKKALSGSYPVVTYSITGYSGGGKGMIADFENVDPENLQEIICRPKNLQMGHKHLPEMQKMTFIENPPHFIPIVGKFYKGMLVFLPVFTDGSSEDISGVKIHEILTEYYADEQFVKVMPLNSDEMLNDGFLSPLGCNDTNRVELFVYENKNQTLIVARLDNLGKGASGAAVQNMNLLFGYEESLGLKL
jgi:N-acetyl-gamma-glutamyl-phosphate reductase